MIAELLHILIYSFWHEMYPTGKVSEFKEKITDSRKRPNAYFGYAVPFSLDVDPASADEFFKDLPYD